MARANLAAFEHRPEGADRAEQVHDDEGAGRAGMRGGDHGDDERAGRFEGLGRRGRGAACPF